MIDFLSSEQDYILETTKLHQIFQKDVDIVENPFVAGFTIFKGFEFDRIYGENFYSGLSNFLVNRDCKEFTFYTLVPDPIKYFFHHFSMYSIGKIPTTASYAGYCEFLDANPGNPADCLMDNAETIAMYSTESTWGIIGSRDLEIGIVGFNDENTKHDFISCFDEETFIDVSTRLSDLDEMLTLSPDTKVIHSQMKQNYSSTR
jgi:hypothetical protein